MPMPSDRQPQTLVEAIRYFSDQDTCISFFAPLRWPKGPHCPRCEANGLSYLKTRRVWKCKACAKQFSVKVGTVFEDSPLGLDKWLTAMWMICNCRNGISSYEVARNPHGSCCIAFALPCSHVLLARCVGMLKWTRLS